MIIDCISDLHGEYPILEGGDLLIIAGDLTKKDIVNDFLTFCSWTRNQKYEDIIVIAGNHDNYLQNHIHVEDLEDAGEFIYLCDSGTEFEGLKIWGSPWTKTFKGMNPHCKAFTYDTEEELAEKWAMIPDNIDILITHSPSFGNYDWIKEASGRIGPSVGSLSLWMRTLQIRPKLHVFGHIHEAYGHCKHENGILLVNASHVNENYEPVNKPIRIIL